MVGIVMGGLGILVGAGFFRLARTVDERFAGQDLTEDQRLGARLSGLSGGYAFTIGGVIGVIMGLFDLWQGGS